MSGYEVFVQPVLFVGLLLTVIGLLARGVTSTPHVIEVDGVDVPSRKWGYEKRALLRAGGVGLVGLFLISALVVVPPGQRGVIYSATGGVSQTERAEGFSLILPLYQSAIMMNVREQKFFTMEAFAQSSDLQEITGHVAVNYFVDPSTAAALYQDVGKDYENIIVKPAVFQLFKQEVGLVRAIDFATNREALAADVAATLTTRLAERGIILTYVAIEDAVFDPAFIQSVKEKVIAEQEAAEQENLIAAEAARKEQVILQAEANAAKIELEAAAQAEANIVIAASLTNDLLDWQQIIRWDGAVPDTLVGDAETGLLLEIPSSRTKSKLRRKAKFWASRHRDPVEWEDLYGMLLASTITRRRRR
jgi:regulator of protease activity HflC (stomatin/prohibitin superfamily)